MTKALYAGSFDPFTNGHLDIVRRAAALFENVMVGVLENCSKQSAFSPEERCDMIRRVLEEEKLQNVDICSFSGLTVELAKKTDCGCILRGIRDANDLSYETKMEALNLRLAPRIQTIYMAASPLYAHVSSSAVKELCAYGASIEGLVPAPIQISIAERLTKR